MRVSLSSVVVVLLCFVADLVASETYFQETFSDDGWLSRWIPSKWKKESEMGKFIRTSGDSWKVDDSIEQGMQTSQDAKFYAISSKLDRPFSNAGEDLVVQFSVKNVDKPSSFCGGGYIKLMPSTVDLTKFGGDSEYKIMFGPDICGYDVSRIHVIFNYKGENLLKKDDIKLSYDDKNDMTHLYTLVVHPDNTYEVYMDQAEKSKGSLFDHWDFPKAMIPDPNDVKPSGWVDEAEIVDPNDKKPEGYDDIPESIPDPAAKKPEDWDDEDDGAWEAPMIPNPDFNGEWTPKMIPNPAYKGPWIQKTIPNPDFDKAVYKFEDIGAVGFELWIVNKGSIFDNIYVGNSLDEAKAMAAETWGKIHEKEKKVKEEWEADKKKNEKSDDEDEEDEDESVNLDSGKEDL